MPKESTAHSPDKSGELRRFTSRDDWDQIYGQELRKTRHNLWQSLRQYWPGDGFPRLIACLLRHHKVSNLAGRRLLEIGCAPAHWLAGLAKILKMIPSGLDYSEDGCELSRQTLRAAGYSPENIIRADFFDAALPQRLQERFDLVCSFGFIEHFSDLEGVVRRHVPLLKPRGWLCVTMPNLLYCNRKYQSQEILARHQLPSMLPGVLKETFVRIPEVRLAWAGYFGVFELRRTFPSFSPVFLANALQRLCLDPPVRLLTRCGIDPELPFIAPHIGAIAQRLD